MQPNAYLPTASTAAMATSGLRRIQSAVNTILDGKEKSVGFALRIGPGERCKRRCRANHKPDLAPVMTTTLPLDTFHHRLCPHFP